MPITYNKKTFIERIKRHIANGWPNSSFSISDNEVMLYIDQSIASNLVGSVFALAKLEGALVMPEAYLFTYLLTISQDMVTKNWYATLPQPPISLPLGYSINRVYAANSSDGEGIDFDPIKAKRTGYRKLLPFKQGARYWVEGDTIWLAVNDGTPLTGQSIYVQMPSTRTSSLTDTMDLPDDALDAVWNLTLSKCLQRLGLPQDIIQDNLPSGNKSS